MANVGFIGLGHMGLPMAINLLKAGHCVTGFDLQPIPLTQLVSAGGKSASVLQELARGQDVIITMLQTGHQVEDCVLGNQKLYEVLAPETLHIDCSTIDVTSARKIHEQAVAQGLLAVDAPVSGGVAGAEAATLTFMVGGSEAAVAKATPFLHVMGKTIIPTGPSGSGQAAKICNNMILGVSMIAVAEAFTLATHLGLTPEKLHQVVTNASGQCWVMSKYPPVPGIIENAPANHDYKPGFTVAMMLKDLCLGQQEAETAGVVLPMAEKARAMYQAFAEQSGQNGLDFSAIIKSLS